MNFDKMILKLAKSYGPIFRIAGFASDVAYTVSDPAVCKRILTDKTFVKPAYFQNLSVGLLDNALFSMPTNSTWFRHRKLLQPAFGPMHLRKAALQTLAKVKETIAYWKTKDQNGLISIKNIRDDVSLTTFDILTLASFDVDFKSIHARDAGQRQSVALIGDEILMVVTKVYQTQ